MGQRSGDSADRERRFGFLQCDQWKAENVRDQSGQRILRVSEVAQTRSTGTKNVGTVLGRNHINIANFSLGRRDEPLHPGEPLEAVALVSTDAPVPENVL